MCGYLCLLVTRLAGLQLAAVAALAGVEKDNLPQISGACGCGLTQALRDD
jgi:hypothetical protein